MAPRRCSALLPALAFLSFSLSRFHFFLPKKKTVYLFYIDDQVCSQGFALQTYPGWTVSNHSATVLTGADLAVIMLNPFWNERYTLKKII